MAYTGLVDQDVRGLRFRPGWLWWYSGGHADSLLSVGVTGVSVSGIVLQGGAGKAWPAPLWWSLQPSRHLLLDGLCRRVMPDKPVVLGQHAQHSHACFSIRAGVEPEATGMR